MNETKLDLAIIPIMEYNKTIKSRGAKNDWIYDCKRSGTKVEYIS